MSLTFSQLHDIFAADWGRLLLTLLIVLASWTGSRAWRTYLDRAGSSKSTNARRLSLVWAKNVFWLCAVLGIGAVWASKIAGVALSLTAMVGALLLVNKELLMCFIGHAVIAVNQPFRIGDFVEIGPYAGKVIDITLFGTVLSETGAVHQLTGKTILVPNSLVLSSATRNKSATGKFIVELVPITVGPFIDFEKAEQAALTAAQEVTKGWVEDAERHLQQIENEVHLDLPSARPKVLWNGQESKLQLVVRIACPLEERVAAEQAVFKRFWAVYEAEGDKTGRPSGKPA